MRSALVLVACTLLVGCGSSTETRTATGGSSGSVGVPSTGGSEEPRGGEAGQATMPVRGGAGGLESSSGAAGVSAAGEPSTSGAGGQGGATPSGAGGLETLGGASGSADAGAATTGGEAGISGAAGAAGELEPSEGGSSGSISSGCDAESLPAIYVVGIGDTCYRVCYYDATEPCGDGWSVVAEPAGGAGGETMVECVVTGTELYSHGRPCAGLAAGGQGGVGGLD